MHELLDPPVGPGPSRPAGYDPTGEALRAIVEGHAAAIPAGGPELYNLPLWRHLAARGFDVSGLAARVVWNQPAGVAGPRTHLLLRVELPDSPWVVDAELGGRALVAPLHAASETPEAAPRQPFRLAPAGEEFELQARVDDQWLPLYRFGLQPLRLRDREAPYLQPIEA